MADKEVEEERDAERGREMGTDELGGGEPDAGGEEEEPMPRPVLNSILPTVSA